MVKINTVEENVVKVLTGKKVIFLENDLGLYHGLEKLEEIFIKNKIEYKCIFDIQNKPYEEVIKAIVETDCIVFQTQWLYAISHKLKDYMFASTDKKIAIEVYTYDPSWYYKPNVVHDVYIFNATEWSTANDLNFYKLSKHRPYWNYKNKFDK